MKFKIFCVLIIAASIAVVLGLALTGKDKAVDPSVPIVAENASQNGPKVPPPEKMPEEAEGRGQPLPPENPPAPQISPEETQKIAEEKAIRMEERRQQRVLQEQNLEAVVQKDQVEFLQDSVNNPSVFLGLRIPVQVSVVSLALNMNDEQEVMLTSYLEAQQKFKRDPSNEKFVNSITEKATNPQIAQYGRGPLPASVDELIAMTEIMTQELKEIQGLKAEFVSGLTKQQQEKFATLAIASRI